MPGTRHVLCKTDLADHTNRLQAVAFTDGRQLAGAGGDRTIKLWIVTTSQ